MHNETRRQRGFDMDLTEIDGSMGEGGGQVLRTALSIAALTGRGVRIANIRANRPNPGLSPQHLTAVRALAKVCEARLSGDELRSGEVIFQPQRPPKGGEYRFDVREHAQGGSAGSATLILQALLIPLLATRGTSRVELRGGTHVAWSPPFDYISKVYLHVLSQMGIETECELTAWGFYPVGGGKLEALVGGLGSEGGGRDRPQMEQVSGTDRESGCLLPIKSLRLTQRGELRRVYGRAVAANLPAHIPQRMADRARNLLTQDGIRVEIEPLRVRGEGPGAGIFLIGEYENIHAGFSALGEKGKPSEHVAEEAFQRFSQFDESSAPVDQHLADQLLLPMALAGGRSEMSVQTVTGHLQTNAQLIRELCQRDITVQGEEGEAGRVIVNSAISSRAKPTVN